MNAGTLCRRQVRTALPEDTLRDAAYRMMRHSVGTLVVVDPRSDGAEPIGIVTDRDLVTRGMAADLDPELTNVAMVMSVPVNTVRESESVEDALKQMSRRGIRRLVVVDDERRMVGILALDDILESLVGEIGSIGRVLGHHAPIYG
ncbi:MAG: CBS domain-containing protein [Gemmatimonadetes bacterium]|nr:CBS domain-containing protein [Gemmatimonadota bacterium]